MFLFNLQKIKVNKEKEKNDCVETDITKNNYFFYSILVYTQYMLVVVVVFFFSTINGYIQKPLFS